MKTKRIFAFLTALVLCLALLPVVPRANAAFVDLHFEPYVFDRSNFNIENWNNFNADDFCRISFSSTGNIKSFKLRLRGEVTLPDGVGPGNITVTKLQWSPGTVFDPNSAHDVDRADAYDYGNFGVRWKDESKHLAEVGIVDVWRNAISEMEAAGLKNTDPFTARATMTWSGGEYTFDHTFDNLRDIDDSDSAYYNRVGHYFIEGLDEPPAAVKAHINNSYYVLRSPSVKKNEDGTFSLTLSYFAKKDKTHNSNEYSGEDGFGGNEIYIVSSLNPNVFSDGHVYPARGVISMFQTIYATTATTKFGQWYNYSQDYDFSENSDYYRYTKTLTFQKGDTVSIAAGRTTSYWPKNSNTSVLNYGTYFHDCAYTFNYTFGDNGDEVPASHKLTIKYQLADGLQLQGVTLPEDYTDQVMEGVTYGIPSPDMSAYGLAPDIAAVTGTMGKEDQTVTVTYGIAHTLTVNYQLAPNVELPDGWSLPADCVMQVLEGSTYTVVTPKLADLTPDKESVTGTMGTENVSATVTYYARVSVTGEENGDELTYTVRYCPVNALLLAARYGANGRMTYARTVTVPAGYSQGTLIMGSAGEKYKLMLVDRTTYAPLCRAWESEPDA